MRMTQFVLAGIMAGAWVVMLVGTRISARLLHPLTVAFGVVVRVCMGVLFSLIAVRAAHHGGFAWIFFPFLVLLAAFSLAFGAFLLWAWATGRLDDDETAGE